MFPKPSDGETSDPQCLCTASCSQTVRLVFCVMSYFILSVLLYSRFIVSVLVGVDAGGGRSFPVVQIQRDRGGGRLSGEPHSGQRSHGE